MPTPTPRASERDLKRLLEGLVRDPSQLERLVRLLEVEPSGALVTARDLAGVFWRLLGGWEDERCAVIAVDNRNRLIDATTLTQGSHRFVIIDVPHVLRWVLTRSRPAAGFAVSHNHPSGDPRPSAADVTVTRLLRDGAEAVGLDFVDHVIVGSADRWYSFEDEVGGVERVHVARPVVQCRPAVVARKASTARTKR